MNSSVSENWPLQSIGTGGPDVAAESAFIWSLSLKVCVPVNTLYFIYSQCVSLMSLTTAESAHVYCSSLIKVINISWSGKLSLFFFSLSCWVPSQIKTKTLLQCGTFTAVQVCFHTCSLITCLPTFCFHNSLRLLSHPPRGFWTLFVLKLGPSFLILSLPDVTAPSRSHIWRLRGALASCETGDFCSML